LPRLLSTGLLLDEPKAEGHRSHLAPVRNGGYDTTTLNKWQVEDVGNVRFIALSACCELAAIL